MCGTYFWIQPWAKNGCFSPRISAPDRKPYCTTMCIIRISESRWNSSKIERFHFLFHSSRALSSWVHEQVTCFSCPHGVAFHIWQKELNLIGNVTSLDRMSTKTLSFPNRYFFRQALHFSQRRLSSRHFQSLQASLRSKTLLHHPFQRKTRLNSITTKPIF